MNAGINNIPAEVTARIESFLDCCSIASLCMAVPDADAAQSFIFSRKISRAASCCWKPSWSGGRCVRGQPEYYVALMHSIFSQEPGYELIQFTSEKERAGFEDWMRRWNLGSYISKYSRQGKCLWRRLQYWEVGAFTEM